MLFCILTGYLFSCLFSWYLRAENTIHKPVHQVTRYHTQCDTDFFGSLLEPYTRLYHIQSLLLLSPETLRIQSRTIWRCCCRRREHSTNTEFSLSKICSKNSTDLESHLITERKLSFGNILIFWKKFRLRNKIKCCSKAKQRCLIMIFFLVFSCVNISEEALKV